MEQGESWVGFSRPLSSLASQSCFPEAWFSTRPGLLVATVASRPEPRPSLPLSSPAWLWKQPPPYEALSPRGTNISSQGGQAGWEVRGHGAPLPVPPGNARQPTKWSREASLCPQGDRCYTRRQTRISPKRRVASGLRRQSGSSCSRVGRQGQAVKVTLELRAGAEELRGAGPARVKAQVREVDQQDPEAGAGTVRAPDRPRRARPPGPRGAGRATGVTRDTT